MNIPIYNAIINGEEDGVYAISLVEYPATEVDWICFESASKRPSMFVSDKKEQILAGVVMIADTPIYRIGPNGEEYYIVFTKETIRMMAEKMLSDHSFNNIDIQHDGVLLDNGSVSLIELFIKDSSRGVDPNYIKDLPDGSLLANYHVNDKELWNNIITNKISLNGFSLEGLFDTVRVDLEENHKMNLKEQLRKLIMTFNEVVTDKGSLLYEEEELAVGIEVLLDGNTAPDGTYTLEDKTVIEVKDGKIVEIKEYTEDETVVEEVVEEVVDEKVEDETKNEYDERLNKLESTVEELVSTIKSINDAIYELKNAISELQQEPVVDPINESNLNMSSNTSFKNRATEIASWIRSLKDE